MLSLLTLPVTYSVMENVALTFIFKFWAEKEFYLLHWIHIIYLVFETLQFHNLFSFFKHYNSITQFCFFFIVDIHVLMTSQDVILTRSSWFISRLQPYFPKFFWVLRTMPAHLSSPFIFYRTVSSNSRSLQQRFESFKIIMPK